MVGSASTRLTKTHEGLRGDAAGLPDEHLEIRVGLLERRVRLDEEPSAGSHQASPKISIRQLSIQEQAVAESERRADRRPEDEAEVWQRCSLISLRDLGSARVRDMVREERQAWGFERSSRVEVGRRGELVELELAGFARGPRSLSPTPISLSRESQDVQIEQVRRTGA